MPARISNIYESKLKFKKMIEAYYRASKGKRQNKEVILFQMDLASNLVSILKDLYTNEYQFSSYRSFTIYDPKQREILSLPFRDRVVHQWYVEEFIKPVFTPKFIKDSYACIEGRGVHNAISTFQTYMRKEYKQNQYFYILKCDISKFFYSIDKNILYKIIERQYKDKRFLNLTKKILFQNSPSDKGIPIRKLYITILCKYIYESTRPLYKGKIKDKILCKIYG